MPQWDIYRNEKSGAYKAVKKGFNAVAAVTTFLYALMLGDWRNAIKTIITYTAYFIVVIVAQIPPVAVLVGLIFYFVTIGVWYGVRAEKLARRAAIRKGYTLLSENIIASNGDAAIEKAVV